MSSVKNRLVVFYPTLSHMSSKNAKFVIIISEGGDMKPLKEKISITVDSDLLAELKAEAEQDERSLSQFINMILRRYLKSKREDD